MSQLLTPSEISVRPEYCVPKVFDVTPSILSLPARDTVTALLELSIFFTSTIIPFAVFAGGKVTVNAPEPALANMAKSVDVIGKLRS